MNNQREVIVRFCDGCEQLLPMDRKGTQSGILYQGGDYYCNKFCMGKHLNVTPIEAQKIVSDAVDIDSDETYYTEWELEDE